MFPGGLGLAAPLSPSSPGPLRQCNAAGRRGQYVRCGHDDDKPARHGLPYLHWIALAAHPADDVGWLTDELAGTRLS
jgi:hypothetical protein